MAMVPIRVAMRFIGSAARERSESTVSGSRKPPRCGGLMWSELPCRLRIGQAHGGELEQILVAVDGEVVALPIGQRGGLRPGIDVHHAADHDAMRVALDDVLDLAIE